jgi:hypothetical protein
VVVALFEHGEHGQLAAPIVRDVLKAYFDKKDRLSALHQQQVAAAFPRPLAPTRLSGGYPAWPQF